MSNHPIEQVAVEHWDKLSAFAYKKTFYHTEDAQDVLSEALAKAYLAWDKVKPTKPLSWLYRIIQTTAIDHHRKRKSYVTLEEFHAVSDWEDPTWTISQLETVLTNLPDRYKSILTLRYVHQRTTEEISNELNITQKQTLVLLTRARQKGQAIAKKLYGSSQ